jgi:hypothetical protein
MKMDRQITQIIDLSTSDITSGKETIDSILEKYPQYAPELRPKLEAVLWLKQARISCATRPGFIIDSRKYLETKIGSMQPISFWKRISMRYTPGRWVFNVTAPVILLVLLALIFNSLVLTARLSIPGDPLYSTKLLLEDLHLAFTFNQADKTALYIQYSQERTTEFVQLILEGDYQVLPYAASRMETDIIASLHSIQDLSQQDVYLVQSMTGDMRETLSNEIFMLNILQRASPPSASPDIELAINVAQSGLLALH